MKKLLIICAACHAMIGFARAQCTETNTVQDQELQTIRVPVGGIATGNLLVGGRGEPSRERVGARQAAWDPERTGLLSGEQHNT